jgi:probable phosphoglycerate mutase
VLELWLVRHGETDWNLRQLLQGWVNIPLNDTGRSQARHLADQLRGRIFDDVWSSDLDRAVETARLAYGEPQQDVALRELDFGDIQGLSWRHLSADIRDEMIGFDDFSAPGGESHQQMESRVLDFLNALPDGSHLVFTHGGVIRMLRRMCGDDRFPGQCEIARLDWTNRRALDVN